jgi:phosphoserine/homoserine phosphotransferase
MDAPQGSEDSAGLDTASHPGQNPASLTRVGREPIPPLPRGRDHPSIVRIHPMRYTAWIEATRRDERVRRSSRSRARPSPSQGSACRTLGDERNVEIACLDLEGVLIPEVWINFAERTGIDALRATTRDIPDYDVLMRQRLKILAEHELGLADIQEVIGGMQPLEGANECLTWLKENFQVVILSDTFYEFAEPFMRQLDWPTLFCHKLETDAKGMIVDYHLRQQDPKRKCVEAFHSLNFRTIATGDSYNDTTMLGAADAGILFRPPQNVIDEFPQFPVATTYEDLKAEFTKASERSI